MTKTARRPCSAFVAPLPLSMVGLMVLNDRWLKPRFHNELTGKLSDIAICFFLPLFMYEVSGWVIPSSRRLQLYLCGTLAAILFGSLELCDGFAAWACRWLTRVGPLLGLHGQFRMTSDVTDLLAIAMIPIACAYAIHREDRSLRESNHATTQRASASPRRKFLFSRGKC